MDGFRCGFHLRPVSRHALCRWTVNACYPVYLDAKRNVIYHPEPMPFYSYSRLSTFGTCPRQYYYRYIAKVPIPKRDSIEQFLGTSVHNALETLYKDCLNGRVATEEELVTTYESEWTATLPDDVLIVHDTYTADDYRRVGEDCLRKYYRRHAPFDSETTLALEDRVSFDIDASGKHKLVGYVDRISRTADGTCRIHDYKTNKKLPSQQEKDQDKQLAYYQIGLTKRWPDIEKFELVWHFVRFDTQIVSTRTTEQLEILSRDTIDLITGIEARSGENAFETIETPLCSWCDYQASCPLFRHESETRELEEEEFSKDDGVRLVDECAEIAGSISELNKEIESLKNKRVAIHERLIAFASSEGLSKVVGTLHEAVIRRVETPRLPTKSKNEEEYECMKSRLRKHPSWDELATIDMAKLKRILTGKEDDPGGVKTLLVDLWTLEEQQKISFRNRVTDE